MVDMKGLRAVGGRVLRRVGIDPLPIRSLRHPLERRRRLLKKLRVDLVIDVGAHEGEYGAELRTMGYGAQIVSFEPLQESFDRLADRARTDHRWRTVRSAIGPSPGLATMNVAANRGASSSFLPMLPEHVADAPGAQYIATEEVAVRRLDEACADAVRQTRAAFLKADVQGYESQVLESASGIMPSVVGLQLEMSLVPLYSGAPTLMTVLELAQDMGFRLIGLEPGFAAADGRLLQADGLFERVDQA
jgi:FkbM family methyltransferase